jgi:hypothetical protein
MSTTLVESGRNLSDKMLRIQAELTYTRSLARVLWITNQSIFNTVPVQIHSSYKEEWYKRQKIFSQFEATCGLVYRLVNEAAPLLPLFPGLHITFEEKETQVEFCGNVFNVVNDMLYDSKTKSIIIPNKSYIGTDDFFHEFGHHVHEFFTPGDNQTILTQQNWMVEENGILQPATLEDLALQNSAEDFFVDKVPCWKFFYKNDEPGKLYRHSNPNEMVAETFTDNYENILNLVTNSPNINRADIISLLVSKCQS